MSTLLEMIAEGEHVRQDFKFKIDDLRKIARTLCAFANTEGGRLLIGVKDNKKIVGCDPEEELAKIEQASKLFCQPEVEFKSKVWQEEFRLVLEIKVTPVKDLVIKSKDDVGKWHPYIRVHDHTTVINKIIEGIWKERKNPKSRPEVLSSVENGLLNLIKEKQPITLSSIYRNSLIPMREIDRLIILFNTWGLIEMNIKKEGTFYKIKEN